MLVHDSALAHDIAPDDAIYGRELGLRSTAERGVRYLSRLGFDPPRTTAGERDLKKVPKKVPNLAFLRQTWPISGALNAL